MSRPESTIDPQLIERLTVAVIQRLRADRTEKDNDPRRLLVADTQTTITEAVTLNQRVIAVADIERLEAESKLLLAAPGAVVTPAALDEIRRRGLRMQRTEQGDLAGLPSSQPYAAATQAVVCIADSDQPLRATAWQRQLSLRGLQTDIIAMEEIQRRLQADAGQQAIIFSHLPAVLVCRFCRCAEIRAASVTSVSEVSRIQGAMQPNLWVLDTERLSFTNAIATALQCARLRPMGKTTS